MLQVLIVLAVLFVLVVVVDASLDGMDFVQQEGPPSCSMAVQLVVLRQFGR